MGLLLVGFQRPDCTSHGCRQRGLTDLDETIDGLRILSGGSSFRGGTSSGVSYIQTGGKGTASVRSFSFTASASGKLKVVASNTGSGAATDGRSVTVQIGDDAAGAQSKEAGSGQRGAY